VVEAVEADKQLLAVLEVVELFKANNMLQLFRELPIQSQWGLVAHLVLLIQPVEMDQIQLLVH
jgi:hypothetical protein